MRKSKKSDKFCPDCVNEDTTREIETDDTSECSSCCCSCGDCESENENTVALQAENQTMFNTESQKKELLSNMSILRTNREPTSIQHVLQFVEALTHSTDFLRRYNLQDDFCLGCMLSEPVCTCCTDGIAQLNVNENRHYPCDECDRSDADGYQRSSSQECTECSSSAKPTVSRRQKNGNRRNRRRNRRQRNTRHNLPCESIRNFPSNSASALNRESTDVNCLECQNNGYHSGKCRRNQDDSHHDNCEECDREETTKIKLKTPSTTSHSNDDDSDFCEECARANETSSSSFSVPVCEEFKNRNPRNQHFYRNKSNYRRNSATFSRTCCEFSDSNQPMKKPNDQPNRSKTSDDEEEMVTSTSETSQKQTTKRCCGDCQENSESSEDSCEECKSDTKKGKKK